MLLAASRGRTGTLLRLAGLAAVVWSTLSWDLGPTGGGRGLVVVIALVPAVIAWLTWTFWSSRQTFMTPDLYVLAICGGVIQSADPSSAGSVFTFVVAMGAAARCGLTSGLVVAALGAVAVGAGAIAYDRPVLTVLAYTLGFAATALGGSNIRQSRIRMEQAELLLAQTQRSHEEALRAARLEESTRIARDIHDVLAHTLAGLVLQLEATDALLARGAEPVAIRERVQRAHALAREGLSETRRAVGALRGEPPAAAVAAMRAVAGAYEGHLEFSLAGDEASLRGAAGEAALRVVQESLTNIRKHAPGAEVALRVEIGADRLELSVENRAPAAIGVSSLAAAGGGYGLRGMRERAAQLGGTLAAGPTPDGWRVQLCLPLDPSPSSA